MLADDLLEFALTYISKEDGNAMKENLMPKKEPLTCILPDGKSTVSIQIVILIHVIMHNYALIQTYNCMH